MFVLLKRATKTDYEFINTRIKIKYKQEYDFLINLDVLLFSKRTLLNEWEKNSVSRLSVYVKHMDRIFVVKQTY